MGERHEQMAIDQGLLPQPNLNDPELSFDHALRCSNGNHVEDPSSASAKQGEWCAEPTEKDWERLKPTIAELYAKNTLEEVRKTMKHDHGLKVSTKMLKDRRRKWNLDKNIKSHEMRAIIRIQAQLERAGKTPVFTLRGSHVSREKIARFRRSMRALSDDKILRLQDPTPPGLVCQTPVDTPIVAPVLIQLAERIGRLLKDYIHGSFDAGTWYLTDSGECGSTKGSWKISYDFHGDCNRALQFLDRNDLGSARRYLDIALARTLRVAQEVEIDCFIQRAGRWSWETLHFEYQRLFYCLKNDRAGATKRLASLLSDVGNIFGATDLRTLNICLKLARFHILTGEFKEAFEVAQKVISIEETRRKTHPWYLAEGYFTLATAQASWSREILAEENFRRAIYIAAGEFGWEDTVVIRYMLHFEHWLDSCGRREEAARVRGDGEMLVSRRHQKLAEEERERWEAYQVARGSVKDNADSVESVVE
ncbi:uncharacterized protein KY384_002769 [Bacidia gigantensis]|uniref:uncharacterized protein n=1 Tax=Bacidia gigantensis TaxID=2732470 RepID=UPI001D05290E|nr:uncharacterized protein KY384_002769 [Bacidia gigantensis]KAG8532891.1 hypothetical protein KY384_002769 [Bacidia gigantensis]